MAASDGHSDVPLAFMETTPQSDRQFMERVAISRDRRCSQAGAISLGFQLWSKKPSVGLQSREILNQPLPRIVRIQFDALSAGCSGPGVIVIEPSSIESRSAKLLRLGAAWPLPSIVWVQTS